MSGWMKRISLGAGSGAKAGLQNNRVTKVAKSEKAVAGRLTSGSGSTGEPSEGGKKRKLEMAQRKRNRRGILHLGSSSRMKRYSILDFWKLNRQPSVFAFVVLATALPLLGNSTTAPRRSSQGHKNRRNSAVATKPNLFHKIKITTDQEIYVPLGF